MAASAGTNDQTVSIDGHRLKLTNLDKVLYPASGTTKADVIDYYARVASVLIPHAANRPATRKRWVHGVGTEESPGEMFFQKNLDERSTPQWVRRREIQHSDHVNVYPLVNDLATLTWLAQIGALELHVPQWQFGRTGARKNPDRLVLDLDPGPGAGLRECAEVARFARDILHDMGLDPMPVTSGSKGIHLYAALDGKQTGDEVADVAHELARALEADHPELIVSDMKKSLRGGKVLVDWSQNNGSKTTITPYSLRGRTHPTVAAPRTWAELDEQDLAQLDYVAVIERVAAHGDPLSALTAGHLSSLEPTPERMAGFQHADGADDRLANYRSMRDASRTPEPVPAAIAPPTSGQTFVIQEHHATRLHFDFRLEHDGVLVSWALPKGVPTDTRTNHLAVQTEDHPLEYGTFEGVIPAGQYGAGDVTIWDRGTYDLEKWRDGKEVIATLHGEKHGSHRYALIQTGGRDGSGNNWLIHLMKDVSEQPVRTARADSRRRVNRPEESGVRSPARSAMPSPMLATMGTEGELGDESEWAFEMKWDGIRAIAQVIDGQVRLASRNGIDITHAYPELSVLGDVVTSDAILDGEIVALNKSGRPDFALLHKRMNLTKKADIERQLASTPVHFMVFDVLEVDGRSTAKETYTARRALLEKTLPEKALSSTGIVQVPPALEGNIGAALSTSRTLGLEGVMAKRRESTYLAGRRTRSWLKVKHHLTQEVVIGAWRPGAGNRSHRVGSLLMGIPDGDSLVFVGRVGTGFTDRELDELATRFRRMERKTSPFVELPKVDATNAHFVSPTLVGEVEFAEWTPTGKLRQPSWRGWRADKSPTQVTRESANPELSTP
jgi:bifunctional non-homologous end joining protein LigD